MFLILPATGHTSHKVHVLHRVAAKLVDILIIMTVAALLPYPLGPFLAVMYSLFGEVIPLQNWRGQSVGKKLLHLRVHCVPASRKFTWKESMQRNAPVGFVTLFALIPVWGWLILGMVGFPLMVMEVYLMIRSEQGQRLGDIMGSTEVVPIEPT